MTEIVIHTVAAATWTRYDNWRVELELIGEPKRVCWLTHAQYDYLQSAFEYTANGYSDKHATVVGTFDAKGYYVRCQATRNAPRLGGHHTPLIEQQEVAHELRDTN